MRLFCIILSILFVTSCSKPPPATPEETVLMKSFGMLQAAMTYDKKCNHPPIITFKADDPGNVYFIGNMQMIAARVGTIMHKRDAKLDPKEGAARLLKAGQDIDKKVGAAIDAQGCDSTEGKAGAAGLKIYTSLNPGQLYQMIDDSIIKAGGTVTPPDNTPYKPEK